MYNLDFLLMFHLALIEILFEFFVLSVNLFDHLYIINGPLKQTKYFGTLLLV